METIYSKDMQMIADALGEETALRLMIEFGGVSFYIPHPGIEIIAKSLEEEGYDAKAVAVKLKVSQSKVYRVLKDLRVTKWGKERQMSLFDVLDTEIED